MAIYASDVNDMIRILIGMVAGCVHEAYHVLLGWVSWIMALPCFQFQQEVYISAEFIDREFGCNTN